MPRLEQVPHTGGAPPLTTALLTVKERTTREPLQQWAERLIARLEEQRRTVRTTHKLAGELAFIGNNAGLIASQRGDLDVAWRTTQRQLWWHGRMARRSRDGTVTGYGLQPWVNLGRLESLTGRWNEALSRFAGLPSYEISDQLEMGCVRLTSGAWRSLVGSREQFLGFLQTIHVTESLKAMLLNQQFERVAPFAARFRDRDSLTDLCVEACVVAECHRGDPCAAVSHAEAAAQETRGWARVILWLRAAEAHTCVGESERASKVLGQLVGIIRQVSPEQKARPSILPVTSRLAAACHIAGLVHEAYAVALDVLEGSRTARDEPIQIESLRILATTSPSGERNRWKDALSELEETTEYARYRCGGPPPLNPVIQGLYEELESVFTN